jgi:hypothetical protein
MTHQEKISSYNEFGGGNTARILSFRDEVHDRQWLIFCHNNITWNTGTNLCHNIFLDGPASSQQSDIFSFVSAFEKSQSRLY